MHISLPHLNFWMNNNAEQRLKKNDYGSSRETVKAVRISLDKFSILEKFPFYENKFFMKVTNLEKSGFPFLNIRVSFSKP